METLDFTDDAAAILLDRLAEYFEAYGATENPEEMTVRELALDLWGSMTDSRGAATRLQRLTSARLV